MNRTRSTVALILLVLFAATPFATAAGQAVVSAAAEQDHVKPGETININVAIEVQPGLHAQSHTPTEKFYIPLTLTPKASPGMTFGPPVYPPGENQTYPGLGTLSVYTGRVVVNVPVTITADAPAGPMQIGGTVRYQACNDKACFPPQRTPFSVTLNIGGGAAVPPATTSPATMPAAAPTDASTASPTDTTQAASSVDDPGDAPWFRLPVLRDDSYVLAFAMAFVVGIIFNAVPCVLPVVPLKIAGFYEAAQHDRRRCFLLGLAFSVGLVASFGVLALFVVVLKTLTWGGLFQQMWFTITIVAVLTIMAASQFGLFTINLPTAAYGLSPRHDTYSGNALFGVLTAALSTPCTIGPFSALLVWALARPPAVGAASIVVVGCGMASPYLVLSAFPQVVRRFPRTGPIGEIIKQTLAFFVLATAFYFARPLMGGRVPPAVFWWALFAIVAIACGFMVVRMARSVGTPRAVGVSSAVAVIIVIVSGYGAWLFARNPHDWQPYSDAALADGLRAGRTVLVDFTADWCGNCQVVEAVTLNSGPVVNKVRGSGVLMLKADVTHGIEAGVPLKDKLLPTGEIPLTAVYTPARVEPTLLKGIYSAADLLRVIGR